MSESNALLFGVMREIGRDITTVIIEAIKPRLDDIEARIGALEAAGSNKDEMAEVIRLLADIDRGQRVLGRIGGEIHGQVAPGIPLPRDLLMEPVMAQFCDHYPAHVAPAVNATRHAEIVEDMQALSSDEIQRRRDALNDSQPDTAFHRYQMRQIDALIATEQMRRREGPLR